MSVILYTLTSQSHYIFFSQIVDTVKSQFKALGFYNFKRVLGGLINGGGEVLYPGGLISGSKKMFRNDEIKRTEKQILIKAYIPLHFELFSYIYNTFIVRYKATCLNAKGT